VESALALLWNSCSLWRGIRSPAGQVSEQHVEQDHRAIKRRTRPMMGFKNFRCARIILSGIETMHMIGKGQMKDNGVTRTAAAQFYSLVA
jgi:transposase-like protein